MKYDKVQIGDVCRIERQHVNPQKGTLYTLYSLPAFDNGRTPEIIDGAAIKSGKLAVQENMVLYNKLNVKYKRVWNIHKLDGANCICSTEFFPLLVNKQRMTQDFLDRRYVRSSARNLVQPTKNKRKFFVFLRNILSPDSGAGKNRRNPECS